MLSKGNWELTLDFAWCVICFDTLMHLIFAVNFHVWSRYSSGCCNWNKLYGGPVCVSGLGLWLGLELVLLETLSRVSLHAQHSSMLTTAGTINTSFYVKSLQGISLPVSPCDDVCALSPSPRVSAVTPSSSPQSCCEPHRPSTTSSVARPPLPPYHVIVQNNPGWYLLNTEHALSYLTTCDGSILPLEIPVLRYSSN